jgi:hypothetical protein
MSRTRRLARCKPEVGKELRSCFVNAKFHLSKLPSRANRIEASATVSTWRGWHVREAAASTRCGWVMLNGGNLIQGEFYENHKAYGREH